MVQPAFQADALQIEPSSGQIITITRDAPTGSMRFRDAVVTAGVNLSDLASLSTVAGALIVGKSGSGAKYTTIQAAINAVPITSSVTNPFVILVFPGVYTENVLLSKDGVSIIGLGRVAVVAAAGTPTIEIMSSVSSTPKMALLQGLRVENSFSVECVYVCGGAASLVASQGVTLQDCDLVATGAGGFVFRADTVNNVSLFGCRSDESDPTAALKVVQTASLTVAGGTLQLVQADYNSAGVIPSVAGSAYRFDGVRKMGNVLSTLSGAGSLNLAGCPQVGNITLNGDRTGTVLSSTVSNLVLGGTSAMTLFASRRGTVAGSGTLDEPSLSGTTVFAAVASVPVVFAVPRSSATYTVALDTGVLAASTVSAKTAAGFTIDFALPQVTTVYWTVSA
jgi:hypothetical protein